MEILSRLCLPRSRSRMRLKIIISFVKSQMLNFGIGVYVGRVENPVRLETLQATLPKK